MQEKITCSFVIQIYLLCKISALKPFFFWWKFRDASTKLYRYWTFMWRHIKPVFAIHHNCDRHVVFFFYTTRYWKAHHNATYFFVKLILQYQITNEWQEHKCTHSVEILNPALSKSLLWIYSEQDLKFQPSVILLYQLIPRSAKGKARGGAKSCAYYGEYCVVQTTYGTRAL